MKNVIVSFVLVTLLASCHIFGRLHSVTTIQPMDSFILGNNEHGSFKVKVKNISSVDLEVYHAPVAGGRHSSQIIKPSQSVKIKVDRNTALNIVNNSKTIADVELNVTGDTGLSMGYKN